MKKIILMILIITFSLIYSSTGSTSTSASVSVTIIFPPYMTKDQPTSMSPPLSPPSNTPVYPYILSPSDIEVVDFFKQNNKSLLRIKNHSLKKHIIDIEYKIIDKLNGKVLKHINYNNICINKDSKLKILLPLIERKNIMIIASINENNRIIKNIAFNL